MSSPEFRERLRRKPLQVRLSVSISADLIAWAKGVAAEEGVPVSRVVAVCIEDHMRRVKVRGTPT